MQPQGHACENLTAMQAVTLVAFLGCLWGIAVNQLLKSRHLAGLCLHLVEPRAHKVLVQVCGTCVAHAHLLQNPCALSARMPALMIAP